MRRRIPDTLLGVLLVLSVIAGVVGYRHNDSSLSSGIALPGPLRLAVSNTMSARTLEITTTTRVKFPQSGNTSFLATPPLSWDFQSPNLMESEPRTIRIGNRYYGNEINVGEALYCSHETFFERCSSLPATGNSGGSTSPEQQSTFQIL
jgi:hypothetical protein